MKLKISPISANKYELLDDYTRDGITVPSGFVTDLASVPRIFWIIVPPFGLYSKAAVIHDYRYWYAIGTKKDTDKQFYKLMLEDGVWKWKAKIMYLAVKLFGKNSVW